eukprot:6867426-Pyramimonas_sp.AAC.2
MLHTHLVAHAAAGEGDAAQGVVEPEPFVDAPHDRRSRVHPELEQVEAGGVPRGQQPLQSVAHRGGHRAAL